jgi:hypothetical protein
MLRARHVASNHAHALGVVYVAKDGGQEHAM